MEIKRKTTDTVEEGLKPVEATSCQTHEDKKKNY